MILSVSRRTDIPAFYNDWFINRINEGFVYVGNSFNSKQINRINITPVWLIALYFGVKITFLL